MGCCAKKFSPLKKSTEMQPLRQRTSDRSASSVAIVASMPLPIVRYPCFLKVWRVVLLAGLSTPWLVLTSSSAAVAETRPRAEVLFDQGLAAMQKGHHETACPLLAESYRLDPLPGVLFTLAECEAAWGKAATALLHYQSFTNWLTSLDATRRADFDERRKIALEKIAALSLVAPELAIEVSPAAPAALLVKRNEEVVPPSSYGVGKKVDPGEYRVSAELEGTVVWERTYTLLARDRASVEVPWRVSPESDPPERSATPVPMQRPAQPADDLSQRDENDVPASVYVVGGIGAAALAAGLVAGGIAWSKKAPMAKNCSGNVCNDIGYEAATSAQQAATWSTIGVSVGAAGIVTAFVLYVTSGTGDGNETSALQPELSPLPQGAFFSVRGAL